MPPKPRVEMPMEQRRRIFRRVVRDIKQDPAFLGQVADAWIDRMDETEVAAWLEDDEP